MYKILKHILFVFFINYSSIAFAQSVFPAVESEGKTTLKIYSSLEESLAKPLITVFQAANPKVEVRYFDLQTLDIYERVIAESDEGGETADLVISSAMDLQVKLTNDGYALKVNPADAAWPKWAQWQDSAFGLTFEPSVIVYNKPFFGNSTPPNNRKDLTNLLNNQNSDLYGKFGTYDIERSGLGFLF
ncbi:MAG: ABC transporter substrate-binding protein, partial [Nitratireductor sp.]